MDTNLHTAGEIMNRGVRALRQDTEVGVAVDWLLKRGYSGAPVVDESGHVVGVLSEHDCVRALLDAVAAERPLGTVEAYLSKDVISVRPERDLIALADEFVKSKRRRVLVTDDNGKLLGLITRRDLMRALSRIAEPHSTPTTYEVLRGLWR